MSKIKKIILGSVEELTRKVTWPSYDELQRSAVLVLIGAFVFAVVIGFMNFAFKKMVTWLYGLF